MPSEPVKLNLGAGDRDLPGFTPIDIKNGRSVFPLDYADNSVDEIYASHVLEHFPYEQTVEILREWVRVLKPGGRIRIAVPNLAKLQLNRDFGSFNALQAYIMGGHVDEYDHHKAVFTRQALEAQMHYVGLEYVEEWESDIHDCASFEISLNLQGIKRGFTINEEPMTLACLSQPRLAFTNAMICLHGGLNAIGPHRHNLESVVGGIVYLQGAFWEKALSNAIRKALEYDPDYLLFADFDSVFDPNDVVKLRDFMQENPDVSACFAVQASRHNNAPLVFSDAQDYTGEATPVQLGHFGLTLVRAQVFRYLPKPWFWSIPNPVTQDWDDPHLVDADILFWRILHEFGHKVVQMNDVVIGHIVEAVKWPSDDESGVTLQTMSNYMKAGRPAKATLNQERYHTRPAAPAEVAAPADNGELLAVET